MTREEQIKNYAINNCIQDDIDDTFYELIIETAEWADETMLDKACEYLESVLEHDLGYYGAIDFADTFRKAMENFPKD